LLIDRLMIGRPRGVRALVFNQQSKINNQQFLLKAPPRIVTRFIGCDPFEGKVPRSGLAALPLTYRQILPPA
jgi:hypothetical protein